MATKKRSWFSLLKKLFNGEAKPETKKGKRRRWVFGRLSSKRLASIKAPSPTREKPASEEKEVEQQQQQQQCRHALKVAMASTAAAEAAVAAARVAAQVVHLTTTIPPPSYSFSLLRTQELSAIKIQTAFRAFLARKALRALKGIVKLQALIRGRAVRRQAMNTLKCLQSLVNIQSQVCTRRINMSEGTLNCDESRNLQTLKDKIIKIDMNSQRRWDDRNLTKEEAEAMILSKKEAAIKRGRIKEYSFNHRKSAESDHQNKGNGKWKYWLEKWVDTQLSKSRELEDLDLSWDRNRIEECRPKQVTKPRQYSNQESDSPIAEPRRSFHHRKQCSLGEDNCFSTSPVLPTYMAATESAKAKTRSLSSPKLRPGSFDTQSETFSPYKNKLCLITNLSGEAGSNGRICRPNSHQQRSPSLRVLPTGPIKSNRSIKDLSFNSECSFSNWTQSSPFR